MADTNLTNHVWPEDEGTGVAAGSEDWDSAAYLGGLAAQANNSDYVETGLGFTVNYTTPSFDLAAGLAFIKSTDSYTVQNPGDNTYDGTWDQGVTFVVDVDAETGIALTDAATNYIYLAIDLTSQDGAYIHVDTDDTAPTDPSLKIGEIDTSADTKSELNRAPSINAEQESIGADIATKELFLDEDFPRFRGSTFGDEPGVKPQVGGLGWTFQTDDNQPFRMSLFRDNDTVSAPFTQGRVKFETADSNGSWQAAELKAFVEDAGATRNGRLAQKIQNDGSLETLDNYNAGANPAEHVSYWRREVQRRRSAGNQMIHRWTDENSNGLWQIQIDSSTDAFRFFDFGRGSDVMSAEPGEAMGFDAGANYSQRGAPSTSELPSGERMVYTSDGSDGNSQGDLVSARNDSGSIVDQVIAPASNDS